MIKEIQGLVGVYYAIINGTNYVLPQTTYYKQLKLVKEQKRILDGKLHNYEKVIGAILPLKTFVEVYGKDLTN